MIGGYPADQRTCVRYNKGLASERNSLTTTDIGMVALGYGKFVRARDIIALIPIEEGERGDGRRTYVHVAAVPGPIVASRSERAILADMARALKAAPLPVDADTDAHEQPPGEPRRRLRRPAWRSAAGRA
jgi:hypothetical protein